MRERLQNYLRSRLREQSRRCFMAGAECMANGLSYAGVREYLTAARLMPVGAACMAIGIGIELLFDLEPEPEPPLDDDGPVVINVYGREVRAEELDETEE
jgi:hypothetical protein